MNKNLWLILPTATIVLFMSLNSIDAMVTDSYSYQGFNPLRPALYPLLYKLLGLHLIHLQSLLWLVMAYIVFREVGPIGMIIYTSTIGLLFLSQKILTETVFMFMLTMAAISKKNGAFLWICLTMLVKPVILFFLPVAFWLYKPRLLYSVIGLIIVVLGFNAVIHVAGYLTEHHWNGILPYISTVITNCFGKTVGTEGIIMRITQVQTFSYVALALCIMIYKHPLALLPAYLIVMSGLAPNQGDRLIIIIAPICLILFSKWADTWKIPEPELQKQYPGGKWR